MWTNFCCSVKTRACLVLVKDNVAPEHCVHWIYWIPGSWLNMSAFIMKRTSKCSLTLMQYIHCCICHLSSSLFCGKVQNMDPLHGPGPWTGSIKIWTGSMDPLSWTRSMDPLFMDRVHGPPIFTSWGCNLTTFYNKLRDYSSFSKPCTSLIAHLPL